MFTIVTANSLVKIRYCDRVSMKFKRWDCKSHNLLSYFSGRCGFNYYEKRAIQYVTETEGPKRYSNLKTVMSSSGLFQFLLIKKNLEKIECYTLKSSKFLMINTLRDYKKEITGILREWAAIKFDANKKASKFKFHVGVHLGVNR